MSPERELVSQGGERVVFRGVELGRSVDPPDPDRWTRVVVWRTDGGSYLAQVDGLSSRPGEVTLRRVHVCETAEALVSVLEHGGRLSRPALVALENAAAGDDRIDDALAAYEEAHTVHVP